MSLPRVQIDRRVRGLVSVLNDIPGVYTFSSCGGHKNPTGSQLPKDQFYVCVSIDGSSIGWMSLELLTMAVQRANGLDLDDPPQFVISPWNEDEFGTLAFHVGGRNGADPEDLEVQIMELLMEPK